jgi:transposase
LEDSDVVIVESTTNAFWMYRQIKPHVRDCYVLNTNAVHLRGNKTDRIDAKKLLQILSTFVFTKTENELPAVYVPSEEVMKLRSLFASYGLFTKMGTQCKNRIHSIYCQNGCVIEKKDLRYADFRKSLLSTNPLDDYWHEQVEFLLEELTTILTKIDRLKKSILHLAYEMFHDEIEILITIPGMSPFTAAAFMSDVCDISRFSSSKKLCAYLKTTPRVKASNKTMHLGPVSKAGRSLTVTLLTQSINHLKTASPAYQDFYERLRVGKSAGKCRIALIRKTVTSGYYMLKRKKSFNGVDPLKLERKHHDLDAFLRGYKEPAKETA